MSDLDAMAESDGKQAASQTVSVDMDAMIDEILARKGPRKYQDGLSEDNWEQVYHRLYLWVYTAAGPHTRAHLFHAHVALITCNFCSKHNLAFCAEIFMIKYITGIRVVCMQVRAGNRATSQRSIYYY